MTRLYVGMQGMLLIADDATGEWRAETQFAGSTVESVALDPSRPGRVYAGMYSHQEARGFVDESTAKGHRGVWRSDDSGATWRDCTAGLVQPATVSLAVRHDGAVYAGSEPSTLSRSTDGGATWQLCGDLTTLPSASSWHFPPRPHTHHVRWIGVDPIESKRLYLCIEAGALIQSADGGATWIDRTADGPWDTHTFATHANDPGRLYSSAGDGFMRHGYGYAESFDRGETWDRIGDGLAHHYLYGMAVDSQNPDTMLVSGASSPDAAHNPTNAESYVYRRTGGGPWQLAMDGLPPAQGMMVPILAAHPTRTGTFYAATNLGLFTSADSGESWQPLPLPWPPHYRFMHVGAVAVGE